MWETAFFFFFFFKVGLCAFRKDPAPCHHAQFGVSCLAGTRPQGSANVISPSMGSTDASGTLSRPRSPPSARAWPPGMTSLWRWGREHRHQQRSAEQPRPPCCSVTAQPTASVLTGIFLGKVIHWPMCITSPKMPESPGNSRGESSYFLLPPTYYSDFLGWYDRLIEFLWCLAMWKPGLVSEDS